MSTEWQCRLCQEIRLNKERPVFPCTHGHPLSDWIPTVTPTLGAASTSSQGTSAPLRRKLTDERASVTRAFRLAYVHKDGRRDLMRLYFTASTYADGRVGEVFVRADRVGSLMRGALDAAAVFASMLLQYGVPLADVTSKLRHTRFEPDGFTGDAEFLSCTSPLDLLAQWLDRRFGGTP